MPKRKRKKIFTLMLVPDQAQDPRSYSISYTAGRILLVIAVTLCVHIVYGGYNYLRSYRLKKTNTALETENASLTAQVKKIDEIFRHYQELRRLREKILEGLGTSLGIDPNASELSEMIQPDILGDASLPALQDQKDVNPPYKLQNAISFLEDRGDKVFNPDAWPNRLPVEGFLTTHFQKGGWLLGRSHYGIDLAARKGTQIRSAGAGVVLMADWTPDFGNIVIISHGNGLYSYYAHAQRLMVRQGWTVRKGQIIALLGNSGISSAPHLHFEIWKDGEPIDPAQILIALSRAEE
jgi:murein DD-endopeptidase MepM/ murein hydrolase activator NlpD